MAKVHTYTKFADEPNMVVTVHLGTDVEPEQIVEDQISGCWKEVGSCIETISQTLENCRPGSKFPLFHRIGGDIPISRLEVDLFANELDKIKIALKKLPLTEGCLVRFRKGKSDVKKINNKDLENFRGHCQSRQDPVARNLYESFCRPIDLHVKMCKEAKRAATGLQWKVVKLRDIKKIATGKKFAIAGT